MAYGAIVGQSPDTSKIEQKIGNIEKNYVPKSGATMTGALNMGKHKVSGVANGTDSGDAVNKGQLDEVKNSAASVPFAGVFKLIAHKSGYLPRPATTNSGTYIHLTENTKEKAYILLYIFPSIEYDLQVSSTSEISVQTYALAYDSSQTSDSFVFVMGNKKLGQIYYSNSSTLVLTNLDGVTKFGPCYYDIYIFNEQ